MRVSIAHIIVNFWKNNSRIPMKGCGDDKDDEDDDDDDDYEFWAMPIPVLLFQTKNRRQPVCSFKHRNRLFAYFLLGNSCCAR